MLLNGEIYLEGSLEMFEESVDPNIKSFFKSVRL
jgi:ABC-type transporter Mla maintaining outer membrane lipid asymmetry ATPase subunit MlaF